jgi:hypothetical protein
MITRILTLVGVAFAMWLVGCTKSNTVNRATSISIPEQRFTSPFDPDKFLAGISIQPEDAVLTSRELLYLSSFFQQTLAISQADGRGTLALSKDTDVFKSLDASLQGIPDWRQISRGEKVDLAAIVELIEKTQR